MRTSIISMSLFSLFTLAACSGGQDTQAANRAGPKKPSTDNGTSNNIPSTDPIPTGGTDCASQWARAVSQMPAQSSFTYDTHIAVADPTIKSLLPNLQSDRVETVVASSDASVSRKITFTNPLITQYVSGAANIPAISIAKDKFISTCQKDNGQPVTVTGLGGDVTIVSQGDDTVSINGQSIKVRRLQLQATNVSFIGTNADASISVYLSTDYPLLPLKQQMTITRSSLSILNGAVVTDTFKGTLPTVK